MMWLQVACIIRSTALLLPCLTLVAAQEVASGNTATAQPSPQPPPELRWHFFPLKVGEDQTPVKCGKGRVVDWYVQVGDYVSEGDPVAEACPHAGTGTSQTCTAPTTGQVVAEQPLGPDDHIMKYVPSQVVAVIQRTESHARLLLDMNEGNCQPVSCDDGSAFEQFLVASGDLVDKGDVVALAVKVGGMIDHCRAPVAGQVKALATNIHEGDDIKSSIPSMQIACVKPSGIDVPKGHAAEKKHQSCDHKGTTAPGAASAAVVPIAVGSEHLRASHNVVNVNTPVAVDDRDEATRTTLPIAQPMAYQPVEVERTGLNGGAGPVLLWSLTGALVTSAILLGVFVVCGKNQTRSLYMLTQDQRDDAPKGLRMDFLDGSGNEKTFNFECQPLGIVFSKQAPIKVERFEFNSYAKDRGVQLGWRVTRIADQEVNTDQTYTEMDRWLQARVKTLACWPLRVDFDTGGGVIKAFYFEKQPLGIELTKRAPFKIALFKPDSYAKQCGAETGWVLVRIGDAVVNQRTSLDVLMSYVNDGLGHLPQEPKGLKIDFREHNGNERSLYFQRRPLGMVLTKYAPVKVETFDFNSYAKERGVQAGWTVARIADQDVPPAMSFEEVDRRIAERTKALLVWPLRMDFDTGGGDIKTFFFEKQPLGMELLNKLPIKVDTFKPDSYAKSCGVEIGWLITRVGDHDVTHETKFEQVIEYLVEGVCELPPVEKDPPGGRKGSVRRGPRFSVC